MDIAHATRILAALAQGTHPQTGEIFPSDSPYQSPDVIRALFLALRTLERAQTTPKAGPRADATPHAAASNAARAAQNSAPRTTNAGKPWSAEEDKQLLAGFDAGKSLADLATTHGRTTNGIRARLEKHGRLEPSPATRWPVKSPRTESGRTLNAG